jgi:tetratricopeptide (TPR) repeat protein
MPMPMVNQYAASYREALANEPDAKDLNGTLGMCYLKLKMYDKAAGAFDKAIEDNFDKPDMFFYAAICKLAGRKAFSVPRADIDKIEEYMNAALMIEPKGIYHYFLAYIKYDFFSRKYINTNPGWEEKFADAQAAGLSPVDVNDLFGILGVDQPSQLTVG